MEKRKVVTIGGGTGSFSLLTGLKEYPLDISAIVAMVDDGGSTGTLRDELGVLPPGDVRQCLVALSGASTDLRELMNYRFDGGGMKGHTFGNLYLSALEKMSGGFLPAVEKAMKILAVRGEVVPVTSEDVSLKVRLLNGDIIEGEDTIEGSDLQEDGLHEVFYDPSPIVNPRAIERIGSADVIVIGPGSLYESIVSNLVVPGVGESIKASGATVILPVNLTNKRGHTAGFAVEDYVAEIEKHIGAGRVDIVIVNTGMPAPEVVERYEKESGKGAIVSLNGKEGITHDIVKEDLIHDQEIAMDPSDPKAHDRSFIRHDPHKLAWAIMRSIKEKELAEITKAQAVASL